MIFPESPKDSMWSQGTDNVSAMREGNTAPKLLLLPPTVPHSLPISREAQTRCHDIAFVSPLNYTSIRLGAMLVFNAGTNGVFRVFLTMCSGFALYWDHCILIHWFPFPLHWKGLSANKPSLEKLPAFGSRMRGGTELCEISFYYQ